MTKDEEIKKLEIKMEESRVKLVRTQMSYRRWNKVHFFNNYLIKKTFVLQQEYHKSFRKLREVMQKEYPERFIGVSQ